jgi:hypothetical protein
MGAYWPQVASLGGGKAAVFWQNGINIEGSVLDTASGKATKPKAVAETYTVTRHEVAGLDNGRVALFTSEVDEPSTEEKLRVYYFDTAMKKVAGPTTLNGSGFAQGLFKAYARTIVGAKSGAIAIYRDGNVDHLLVQPLNAKGKMVGRPMQLDSTPIGPPQFANPDLALFSVDAARLKDDRIAAAWTVPNHIVDGKKTLAIRARILDMAGKPTGSDFLVIPNPTHTSFGHYEPKVVALANGGFAISWVRSEFGFFYTHWIRAFGADGTPVGDAVQIAFQEEGPGTDLASAALADGSVVHAYSKSGAIWADGVPKGDLD